MGVLPHPFAPRAYACLSLESKVWYFILSLPQEVSRQLWHPVSGKQPFPVSSDPHRPLDGCEIREVPYLFPNEEGTFIAFCVDTPIVFTLEFLTEHAGDDLMKPVHGVCPIFREHHRFILLLPEIQFQIPSVTCGIQITAQVVPAIIAV